MKFDPSAAFGVPRTEDNAVKLKKIPFARFSSKLEDWISDPEGLSRWIAFHVRWEELRANQMNGLADLLYDGRVPFAEAVGQFDLVYFETLLGDVYRRHPLLEKFSGKSHDRIVEEFRRLDRERIKLARREVALAHYDSLPKGGSEIGEIGIVRGEIAKKRRHMAIRKLLSKAGRAVQAVKPVFMMSPLSVAQYLEPGASGSTSFLLTRQARSALSTPSAQLPALIKLSSSETKNSSLQAAFSRLSLKRVPTKRAAICRSRIWKASWGCALRRTHRDGCCAGIIGAVTIR